jgi:hypothetical protein
MTGVRKCPASPKEFSGTACGHISQGRYIKTQKEGQVKELPTR